MKQENHFSAEFTGRELYFLFMLYTVDLMKSIIPEFQYIVMNDSISLKVYESGSVSFKGQITSVHGVISEVIDVTLAFPTDAVVDRIIDEILQGKRIKKTLDLNIIKGKSSFVAGDLLSNSNEVKIVVEFNIDYDDPSDHQ
jgi:hypothetical protein